MISLNGKCIIGESISVQASKIKNIELKDMATDNLCKIKAVRGKGKRPCAIINKIYTRGVVSTSLV